MVATSEPPRKKKRKQAPRSTPERPTLDAQGRERPAFVLAFPEDPALDRLVAAFERGDYWLVRSEAERVAAEASDPAVRRAATELRRRVEPDPLARYLVAVAAVLLLFLTAWTYAAAHGH